MIDDHSVRLNDDPFAEGATPERAVVVGSVGEEYAWVARHFPGATLSAQLLRTIDGRALDVLILNTHDGGEREVFFDISAFYGTVPPTADCPYCGKPLRTSKARQCRACGMDWHDQEHPVNRRTVLAAK